MSALHPAFVLFVTACVAMAARGVLRQIVLLAGTLATLWTVWQLDAAASLSWTLPNYTLHVLQVDALSHVFGLIFSLIACIGVLYALHVRRGGEHAATLVYAGGGLGVVFAGDWITLFVFWELMAVASLFVVWFGGTAQSQAAGYRYLLVHIFGGSLLFCGILLHLLHGGEITLAALTQSDTPDAAFWLILLGVAINAAVPPLHAWLTDAYPEASVTGSVFLSAFTTKTAVYVLIRLFPGAEVLLWAGVVMTLYGVVYAILENDIRRLLAYHIVSQVGYMVAAVGMGTALALNGSGAHAFCHILYKALLFMGAGAVIQATGKRKLSDLGGLSGTMPLVFILYMIAAFSISGVPLFNGFTSKSMIVSAAAYAHLPLPELLLTLAGVGTFLSVGLKLPYFTFMGGDRGLTAQRLPVNMLLAMGAGAVFCVWLGLFPQALYERLPFHAEYHPFTVDHVVSSLQLLIGTGLAFWWLLDRFHRETTVTLDTDWFYRRPLQAVFEHLIALARQVGAALESSRISVVQAMMPYARNPYLVSDRLSGTPLHLPSRDDESLPEDASLVYDENRYRLPIGATVMWIVVFLAGLALVVFVAAG